MKKKKASTARRKARSAPPYGSAFPDEPCDECGVNTLKLLSDNAALKKRDWLWKRLCKNVSKERDILFNQSEMLRSELKTTERLLAEKNETANTFMRQGSKLQSEVRRAAARTLKRLKEETVLRPIGPICMEEWQCCRDIITEEMTKLLPND